MVLVRTFSILLTLDKLVNSKDVMWVQLTKTIKSFFRKYDPICRCCRIFRRRYSNFDKLIDCSSDSKEHSRKIFSYDYQYLKITSLFQFKTWFKLFYWFKRKGFMTNRWLKIIYDKITIISILFPVNHVYIYFCIGYQVIVWIRSKTWQFLT